jgi:hypothetical protein
MNPRHVATDLLHPTVNWFHGTMGWTPRATNLHHHHLRRVAPGAHGAFEAAGADADPDGGAGGEAAEGRFAAAEHAGRFPIGVGVRVADVGLHFVHAALAVGAVAGDERSAEVALADAEFGRGGGWMRRRGACGFVGGETALADEHGVAVRGDVDVVAEVGEVGLEVVTGGENLSG